MKKTKLLAINMLIGAAAVLAFSGCKKFLDRQPLSSTVNDTQVGALESPTLGLYGALRNSAAEPFVGDGMQNIPWLAMNGFRSDDAEIVADPGATAWHQTYDNFQYVKDDWGAGLYWDKHYAMINLCNDIIVKAEEENLTDDASMKNVAEAKFWRAYTYFEMVRTFGDIPKIDFKINSPTDAQIAKSSSDDIYAFIIEDLTFASNTLPVEWLDFPGRATSGAARTLLAKVNLYQENWGATLSLCEAVINSNHYTLVPDYYTIFKTSGELNAESILEIQAEKTSGDANIYWSRFGQTQGIRGAGGTEWDLGWGWNTPTTALVNSYESGDKRKDATILVSGQPDGGVSTGGYGKTLPALSNAQYWNKKVYNTYDEYIARGLGLPNNESQNTWVNYRALRYSDVLLMAAEAANEIGGSPNTDSAETWVNRIRNRAGLPDITYTTQTAMRDEIKKQRRAEFAMEMERFFDLVRWGDADAVLAPLGYQHRNRYYPIPTGALNANPNLVQNPDYP
jgi:hypothetical protein